MIKLAFPVEFNNIVFSEELKNFFEKAAKYARIDKQNEITVLNLFYSILLDEKENAVTETLEEMKVDLNILYEILQEKRKALSVKDETVDVVFGKELISIITTSYKKVKQLKGTYETIDFMFAALKFKNELTTIFNDNSIDHAVFKETYHEIAEFLDDNFSENLGEPEENDVSPAAPNSPSTQTKETKSAVVAMFTTNLNEEYKKGNLTRCIGRTTEIKTLERILNRKNKKNSIIVGKAGVGKTQIVEGLVYNIMEGKSSAYLKDKIIYQLNVTDLISNTVWRGQFEERVKILLNFLSENPNIILWIDEIHSIIGTGGNANSDLANMLKPALSKDKIQVIGASTHEEYRIHIEKDKALTRRFFVQHVDELTKDETLEVLTQIKGAYEEKHNVIYTPHIFKYIVEFSDEYLKNKNFPDKAIEIMDDLGALKKISIKRDEKAEKLQNKLSKIKEQQKHILKNKEYEKAEHALISEEKVKVEIQKLAKNKKEEKQIITDADFFEYVKIAYNIKNFYGLDYDVKIENVELNIKKQLFGQDNIIESMLDVLKTKHLFNEYDSPATFFFLGESGVGKTYMAELLAKYMFNDKFKKVSGENYQQSHSISNFIGSPKGYVDSDSGSSIFDFVKYNPESVVLVDEIEKTHPTFRDLLLTIMDKGLIEDKNGEVYDFRRSVIIFTSNVGVKKIKQFPQIGFSNTNSIDDNARLDGELRKEFSPEFLNRLDEIYYFNKVDHYEFILNKELDAISETLKQKNIEFSVSEETKNKILEEFKNGTGAVREQKRIIRKYIHQEVSKRYKKEKTLII